MHSSPHIQFLKNHEIDKHKWDKCIRESLHRLIYARAFYLDNMAEGWCALAGQNYEWVLPITFRRKYGVTYLHQPPFCQQLGVFAKPTVIAPFKDILEWLKKHYSFWEINLNYATDITLIDPPVKVNTATNFILNLSDSYEIITSKYQKDLVKNLKRSQRFQLKYQHNNDYNKGIELFKKYYGNRLANIKADDYKSFSNICAYALQKNKLLSRQVVNSRNELMSIVLILMEGKRSYNLMNVTTEEGKQVEANHFLLDGVIKEFAGQELMFDFEGSDVPGIKKFYRNFGAENQPYYQVKYNNLPWPLRQFKE